MKPNRLALTLFLMLGLPAIASAQTGVSDDRVSLPEGPGSLEGVGENIDINTNMGSMSHSVAINVPSGFGAVTPSLGISYSSGSPSGILGMGWSMGMPAIERMTYRGLPEYDSQDDFSADGSDQLVRLPGTNPPIYRSRFEKGFARYTWMDEGDGTEGYWIAEYPDGSKAYFGATADGTLVPTARVSGSEGTFRYQMVEKVDVHGHRMVWTYEKFGLYSLPTNIGYVFKDGQPTYEIDFTYQERSDADGLDLLSDAMPGFNLILRHRLENLAIKSRGVTIRQYDFTYVPFNESAGITLLQKVEKKGVEGGTYPIVNTFEYSKNLGGEGNEPFMIDMGTVEASFGTRTSQLIDINGDALPDIVDATQTGNHKFFLNIANTDGTSTFEPVGRESQVGTRSSHDLSQATVQVLDVNGDGFTDLINAATGQVLINKGGGDWDEEASGQGTDGIAAALEEDFDAGEGGLQSLRFIDFNNDKQIDLMRATAFETAFFKNEGDEGFDLVEGDVAIGAGFVENNLELADMNGDGLLDVVQLQVGAIRYRLNFGRGLWSDWVNVTGLDLNQAQIEAAELEDINGDALADLVIVQGTEVSYALNDNFEGFDDLLDIDSDDVNGIIPLRDSATTVLFADMNGNGSSDIVWITPNGKIDALELFPLRPNLMTRMTNNIGAVTVIEYETAAQQMARDGGWENWPYKIPFPMNVVSRRTQTDLLTNLTEITEYRYHDGFYDGDEKAFRGFERVETRLLGDETIEEGLTREVYDVGVGDTYRNGLLLSSEAVSDGRELSSNSTTFDDCPLAELTENTELPIRYICPVATRSVLKEGLSEDRWIVTETATEYDGYGNVTRSSNFGITSRGGGTCEPCGDRGPDDFGTPCGNQCLGDEIFVTTEYVPTDSTGGRWILGMPFRSNTFGREGSSLVAEDLTYYDGPDFVGLPLGNLTLGNVTRSTEKKEVGSSDVIQTSRNAHDDHGNIIDTLDPLGSSDGHTHRRQYTYDAENLRVIRAEALLEDPDGNPYRLRREVSYEPLFDRAAETTAWMRVVGDNIVSTRRAWTMTYDEFGRMDARFLPGNTTTNPDAVFAYDLQSPTSRIITQQRSQSGGPLDLESIDCFDGRGRSFQTRTKLSNNRYQVTGFRRFNIRSQAVEVYQPHIAEGPNADICDTEPQNGVFSVKTNFDALYRPLVITMPDEGIYGTASTTRTVYEPLATLSFDTEDTETNSPHHNTPTTFTNDGLGRLVSIERRLSDTSAIYNMRYDSLGRMKTVIDPGNNLKEQGFDLFGRVVRRTDPNTADEIRFEYDDASNLVRTTDARGVTTVVEFDGLNRPTVQFDEADRSGTLIEWRHDFDPNCDALLCTNTEGEVASISYPGIGDERSQEQMGFDLRSRIVVRRKVLAGVAFDYEFNLDNASRISSITYPTGKVIENTYDGSSRLTAVQDLVHTITYNAQNQLNSMGCTDGSEMTLAYDDLMRVTEMKTVGASSQVLQGFGYQFDRANNISNIEDLSEIQEQTRPDFTAEFLYDAWYRTTQAHIAPGQSTDEVLGFEFDLLDNIVAQTSSLAAASSAPTGELEYNSFAPNAVTDFAGMAFDYDAAGNTTLRGDQSFTWDFKGRMTEVTQDEQQVARFVYGPSQSRVAKIEGDQTTLYPSKGFEVRDGIAHLYIKIGGRRVARIESDTLATSLLTDLEADGQINAADARAAHTQSNNSGPHLWSSVRRLLMETGPDDGTTFLHFDHIGSITMATGLIDGEQQVLGQRAFFPTGTERSDSFGYVDEYGFTGQEIDRSTGLLHFDWRYLDPQTGRWLSIDPMFATSTASNITKLGEATTAYAYVAGQFTNSFDPTGLCKPNCPPAKTRPYRQKKEKKYKKNDKDNDTGDSGGGDSGGGDNANDSADNKLEITVTTAKKETPDTNSDLGPQTKVAKSRKTFAKANEPSSTQLGLGAPQTMTRDQTINNDMMSLFAKKEHPAAKLFRKYGYEAQARAIEGYLRTTTHGADHGKLKGNNMALSALTDKDVKLFQSLEKHDAARKAAIINEEF